MKMKKKKDIKEKLEKIRKAIGQTIVVHIGLPKDGGYDIIGIECCGEGKEKDISIVEIGKMTNQLKKEVTYIG